MPTPIVMPQMGESIAEGTIVRWIKKVGDEVDRDEPLFEITTDKVDAEIPSPAAGILVEITAREGDTVLVNSVVGTIQLPGEAGDSGLGTRGSGEPKQEATPGAASVRQVQSVASAQVPVSEAAAIERHSPASREVTRPTSRDDLRRQRSSPLVRRIAREQNVDIAGIAGTGVGGRVTRRDVIEYLGTRDSGLGARGLGLSARGSEGIDSGRVDVQPLSIMRRKIAEHMVLSQRTSAHVHTVFHVDFSAVQRVRQATKDEKLGTPSYMAFIASAVAAALRRHPIVNASLDGNTVIYRKDVNLGIAVALEGGLIVPVVRNADEKDLSGLHSAIADLAARARAKQLKPDEVHGGTFTITNPGQFGAQFGMPIINQPQVAILGVGTIEKRPVVVDESVAIRPMAYLTLGFDHRLIDGAVADEFMADIRKHIEQFLTL